MLQRGGAPGRAVHEATSAAVRVAAEHEIVIVDDGSTDATRALALELEAANPAIRTVFHATCLGYGAALRTGIAIAAKPWILLTDARLRFDLAQLEDFLPFTADHDMLLGRRVLRTDPIAERIAGRLWRQLVHALFALDVADVDCPFKLVRADLVKDLELTSEGRMFPTELIRHPARARAAAAV